MIAAVPTGPDVGIKLTPQAPPPHPSANAGAGINIAAMKMATNTSNNNRFMLTFIVLFGANCQVLGTDYKSLLPLCEI
jgi:hypothetical protein